MADGGKQEPAFEQHLLWAVSAIAMDSSRIGQGRRGTLSQNQRVYTLFLPDCYKSPLTSHESLELSTSTVVHSGLLTPSWASVSKGNLRLVTDPLPCHCILSA